MTEHDPFIVLGKENVLQILLLNYLERLFDCSQAISYSVQALGQNQDRLVEFLSQGSGNILENLDLWHKSISPQDKAAKKDEIANKMEELNRQRVGRFLQILINQQIVLMCSVVEIYFNHILDTILQKEPRTILTIAPDQEIPLEFLLDSGNYETILESVRQKQIHKFGYASIEEKFGKFRALGIDSRLVFDASTINTEAQQRIGDFSLERLKEIFERRNKIIHKGASPFSEAEEVAPLVEFFQHLMFQLAIQTSKKYQIPIDFLGYYGAWMKPPE